MGSPFCAWTARTLTRRGFGLTLAGATLLWTFAHGLNSRLWDAELFDVLGLDPGSGLVAGRVPTAAQVPDLLTATTAS